MKFKNIFLITFLLLAVFSISAVSAEEIDDSAADVLEDINVDDNVLIESSLDSNIIADDDSGSNDTKSSIESSDLTKYYKNESQYIATFYDANGTPLNGTVVTLKINNGEYHRTTNESGTVKFNVNLPSGNYTMDATNPVTGESVVNNIEVLSTISSMMTSIKLYLFL